MKRLRWIAPLLLLPTWLAAAASPAWPFGVTPVGEPSVRLVLAVLLPPSVAPSVTLRHEIEFDGVRYFSRLVVPELESSLLSHGPREMLWTRFGGGRAVLQLAGPTRVGSRTWRVQARESGGYCVRADDGQEAFDYDDGGLVYARLPSGDYDFVSTAGRILRIERRGLAGGVVAEAKYTRGRLQHLRVGGKEFAFRYDTEGLVACDELGAGRTILTCRYRNALLHEVSVGSRRQTYVWAVPKRMEYFNSAVPLPPVVVADRYFSYRPTVTRGRCIVEFEARNALSSGRWIFDPRTEDLAMTVRGDLAAARNPP